MKILVQKWEESERGWGCRPDGYSLHRDQAALDRYIKTHWDGLPYIAPSTYSRPCGMPYEFETVDPKIMKAVKSKDGVREGSNNYPGDGGPDGWK